MSVPAFTWFLSIGLHAVLVLALLNFHTGSYFESGSGDDLMMIERGVVIEGLSMSGRDEETVDAVEAEPLTASAAQAELEEIKAEEAVSEPPLETVEAAELPKDTEVITAQNAPEAEAAPVKPEEITESEQPQPEQLAAVAQPEQIAVIEQQAAGAPQEGGSVTQRQAYYGKMAKHLQRRKVNPRTRQKGTVVVRFTVNQDGAVISSEIVTSSGVKTLDEAALESLRRASPFPPFSSAVSAEPLVMSVPFRYSVR
jgi:protein TonB